MANGKGRRANNVDQLRNAVDEGRAGDKVDFPDPTAAPLGTDDEASDHPVTREQLSMAAADLDHAPGRRASWRDDMHGLGVYLFLVLSISAAILTLVALS